MTLPLPPDPGAATRVRVLVVDDQDLVREALVELLGFEGYEVFTATDGRQALEVADQARPRAVLLDMNMPVLSGLETARRLRARHAPHEMALVLLSGVELHAAWREEAARAGFDDCVDKTAEPARLLACLRRLTA
jgi:two-component system response regulator MprA